ncbi:MAG TPA: hypothetical protein VHW71_09770 [Steroidobacteraceae bacterium]|nr:hypothetical protein [Steroidobacteraceae bacterium]
MSSQYFRFSARAAEPQRSPLLEQLIARADGCSTVVDWRGDAFHLVTPDAPMMPAVGAAVLCADRGAMDAAWVCLATPVHYVAGMNSVSLAVDGMLSLTPAVAETLAADFNRVLGGAGVRLVATRSAQLIGLFDRAPEAATHDPQDVRGRPIEEYLPSGAGSARLRLLMSEMEMWLSEHAANEVRNESGQPVLNGLWLWGGGAALASLPRVSGWCAGDDVFFGALGAGALGAGALSAQDCERNASGVVAVDAVPGSKRWSEAEARWLEPASEQLKSGKLAQLQLSADDRCFTVSARGMRRFWRRSKPWQESFG